MRNNSLLLPLLLFLLGILLAGCVTIPSADQLKRNDLTIPQFSNANDLLCQEANDPQPCTCMYCQSHNTWTGNFLKVLTLGLWYDDTLYKGDCKFIKCNATDFNEEVENRLDKAQIRTVMIGQGPRFISADRANLYCNYSLQLATRWMKGNALEAPRVPIRQQAVCWLDHNTLPIFMYYTKGENIDAARTGQIALKFKDVGPVLLTTEVDVDSGSDAAVQAVKAQIDAIDSNCPDCMLVLAVKSGDTMALRKILGTPPNQYSQYYDKVDVVGFGFRANDYPTCKLEDVIGTNYLFSREILKDYHKPTIWLYAGASQGNNTDGSCKWDAEKVRNFYQNIFAISQAMASSGIIGVSFYEFVDNTGPLPCNNVQGCGFGVMSATDVQKHPELNTFSGLCEQFGTQQYRSSLVFSRSGYGGVCDFFKNTGAYREISQEINTQKGLQTSVVEPFDKQKYLQCGEICPEESEMKRPEIFDEAGRGGFSTANCGKYEFIEEYADDLEISAIYYRALIEQESSFNEKAVSCKEPTYNCNRYNVPMLGSGSTKGICDYLGIPSSQCPKVPASCSTGLGCAFGIAQCIEYPGQYYVQNNLPIPNEIKGCGTRGDGTDYNPFNPKDSVCCGTKKFKDRLDKMETFVESKWDQMKQCTDGMKDDEKGWVTYYLASNLYFGHDERPKWVPFLNQRDVSPGSGDCSKPDRIENFIDYVRSFSTPQPPGHSYGAEVMTHYLDAVGPCDSECPGRAAPP